MSPFAHRIYIGTLSTIVALTTGYLLFIGIPYYSTALEERFYHPEHDWFKPSGVFGHGLGIVGTLLILIGVFGYMARKRYKFLSRLGRLKYWLEFHTFLCTLGPIMVLFHTAFKFGGIVSVSFWSMVAVVASGVIGRYIYVQIPRTIEGRELGLRELQEMKNDMARMLKNSYGMDEESYRQLMGMAHSGVHAEERNLLGKILHKYVADKKNIMRVERALRKNKMSNSNVQKVTKIIKGELSLHNRIERLLTMQKLFRYWHVAHLPFALVMLIVMVIHVAVTLAFGYKWIF